MKLLTDEYIGAERFGIPLGEILAETGDVFDFRTHTHSYYEMTLYRPFNGGVFINNGFVPIASTTAILISPSDFHSIKVTGQASGYIKLSFDNTVIGGQNTQISSVIVPNLDKNGFASAAFREALEHCGDKAYLKTLINTIVYRLLADGKKGHTVLGKAQLANSCRGCRNNKRRLLRKYLLVVRRKTTICHTAVSFKDFQGRSRSGFFQISFGYAFAACRKNARRNRAERDRNMLGMRLRQPFAFSESIQVRTQCNSHRIQAYEKIITVRERKGELSWKKSQCPR